jgi:hypothetical protein
MMAAAAAAAACREVGEVMTVGARRAKSVAIAGLTKRNCDNEGFESANRGCY